MSEPSEDVVEIRVDSATRLVSEVLALADCRDLDSQLELPRRRKAFAEEFIGLAIAFGATVDVENTTIDASALTAGILVPGTSIHLRMKRLSWTTALSLVPIVGGLVVTGGVLPLLGAAPLLVQLKDAITRLSDDDKALVVAVTALVRQSGRPVTPQEVQAKLRPGEDEHLHEIGQALERLAAGVLVDPSPDTDLRFEQRMQLKDPGTGSFVDLFTRLLNLQAPIRSSVEGLSAHDDTAATDLLVVIHELEHVTALARPIGFVLSALGLRTLDERNACAKLLSEAVESHDEPNWARAHGPELADRLRDWQRWAISTRCVAETVLPLLEGLALYSEGSLPVSGPGDSPMVSTSSSRSPMTTCATSCRFPITLGGVLQRLARFSASSRRGSHASFEAI